MASGEAGPSEATEAMAAVASFSMLPGSHRSPRLRATQVAEPQRPPASSSGWGWAEWGLHVQGTPA